MNFQKAGIAAAFAVMAGIPAMAQAVDGTITFTGAVTAQTCTINGNGAGSKDFTVALPSVSTSALSAAGQTAGQTPFSIALTKCSSPTGSVHTFFEPGATTDLTTGNLIVATGGATNVQIGLANADLSPIKAGAADASQNSKSVSIVDNAATLQYYARYVATGAATAGAANSSVMYSLVYQ
ncbi:type 1 fimbrial protein [Burkholderia stagnalis]|nr:type 1 fimbrial protein [Burkholderia stagnalis]RQQ09484.1 type 1 fimbrial protein [Burkholderia stagnalis]RQQ23108.1 type 1 fimbrial protein [Burkholderia stagnalis]RQQ24464.1 type 1 fimbrial protein [Burkholderia stagnalis]RQQ28693.1 type 1 fimbrial protein [Burkholderia stagnalis]